MNLPERYQEDILFPSSSPINSSSTSSSRLTTTWWVQRPG